MKPRAFDLVAMDLLQRAKDMLEKFDDVATGPFRDDWTSLIYEIELLLSSRAA